jgi:MFS family permease
MANSEQTIPLRRTGMMLALMIGVFLSPLNVVFSSIALPTMRAHFDLSVGAATWVGTAYFIPSVVFMPLQTYLAQRWGSRRLYTGGLLLLGLGAVLTVLAPNYRLLLTSRILQGVGWSALYPLALLLIRRHYPERRQGAVMGLWESAVGLATIIAPLLGGLLIARLDWQAVYLVLALVAGIGALLTPFTIPAGAAPGVRPGIDWLGAAQFTLLIGAVLSGIALQAASLLLLSAGLGAWWFWRARRQSDPFVSPRLLGNRRFVSAGAAAALRMMGMVAILTSLPLFFEEVQGLTPARVGVIMAIYSVFLFLLSWPGGRWADAAGARVPGYAGFAAMSAGMALMLGFGTRFSLGLVTVSLVIRGIGAGLAQTPYAKAALEVVPEADRAAAAGLYGTVRYGGLALGTALVGLFLGARLDHYGAGGGGAAALPAYRELWLLLTALVALGLPLTSRVGRPVGAT